MENLTFEDHRRDGVHCAGPASFGIIRGIRGRTGDDPVSLLSWDWRQCSASFGPIHHILVEDVSGAPLAAPSTDAIRLRRHTVRLVEHQPGWAELFRIEQARLQSALAGLALDSQQVGSATLASAFCCAWTGRSTSAMLS